jgi:hypothetical protein
MEYTHSDEFRAAGYEAMVVDGTEYGEVRQYGNFSFARVYESGHEVPYYQRKFFFFDFFPTCLVVRWCSLTWDV